MFLIYLYVFLLTETFPIPINVIYTDDRSETRSPINISPLSLSINSECILPEDISPSLKIDG